MLSNDMHLNLGIPNIWYEADLKAGEFHVAGRRHSWRAVHHRGTQ